MWKRILLLGAAALMFSYQPVVAGDKQDDNWIDLLSVSQGIHRSQLYRDLDPRKLRGKVETSWKTEEGKDAQPAPREAKRMLSAIAQSRGLVKRISTTKDASPQLMQQFGQQIDTLDQQMGSFASSFPPSGSVSSCMSDCATEFPGIGHGAGINRALCKAGCLAIAIGGNNPD
ncbi:MAG: hypothetical protein AAF529_16005 [Pseudomonadota bacterium]